MPTHVQNKTATATGTSIPVTFDSNVTAGNSIHVVVRSLSVTVPTVDDGTNSYSKLEDEVIPSGSFRVQLWAAHGVAGGATTVTASNLFSDAGNTITVLESNNAGTLHVSDSFGEGAVAATTYHCAPSGAIDTTVATLIVAAIEASGNMGTITPPSGFTMIGNTAQGATFYLESAGTETDQRATSTGSGAPRFFAGVIGAFEGAAANATKRNSTRMMMGMGS